MIPDAFYSITKILENLKNVEEDKENKALQENVFNREEQNHPT